MDRSEVRRRADETLSAQYSLAGLPPDQAWAQKWLMRTNNFDQEGSRDHISAVNLMATHAQTYGVTSEMTELVKTAAENLLFQWMEGDLIPEAILPYDLPSKVGFVLFPHHINMGAMTGVDPDDVQPINGFLWADMKEINRIGTGQEVDPRVDLRGMVIIPLSSPDRWADFRDDERYKAVSADYVKGAPHIVSHDWMQWSYGLPWRLDPEAPMGPLSLDSEERQQEAMRGPIDEATGKLTRLIHPVGAIDRAIIWSFFRLVEQKVPVTKRARPGRQATRRAMRRMPDLMTKNLDDGQVRIVMLRREAGDNAARGHGDGSEVEWSHRWQVEPHWARRRVAMRNDDGIIIGSRQGEEGVDWTYRRVWIERHEKGPEDKPLVLKDAVSILKR